MHPLYRKLATSVKSCYRWPMTHTALNPLNWGAENGGPFLVGLVVAVAVLVFVFCVFESRAEKRYRRATGRH